MITAIIPVRAGSQRLKDKNVLPFADSNLLIHKIKQLKKVPSLDRIVVSSDSDLMLDMAKKEGVLTHKRAPEYCDEKTKTFGEVVAHVCDNVEGDDVIWATCTCPLIMPEHYEEAIGIYKDLSEHDSLMAVRPFKKYIWDDNKPVNFEAGKGHIPSQQLPQYYFTTGLRIAPREKMVEWNYFVGPNPYKYVLPDYNCIDIDNEMDLRIANALYNEFFQN